MPNLARGMGNSLPALRPSLVQEVLYTIELVSDPWDAWEDFKEKLVNNKY